MEENKLKKNINETKFFVAFTPVLAVVLGFIFFFGSRSEPWGLGIVPIIITTIIFIFSIIDLVRSKKGISFWFIVAIFFMLISISVFYFQ